MEYHALLRETGHELTWEEHQSTDCIGLSESIFSYFLLLTAHVKLKIVGVSFLHIKFSKIYHI